MGIIYKVFNKISKKVYVGQTTFPLKERIRKHYNSTKSNKSYHFLNALRFYEKNDWEWSILEENVDRGKLNEREKYHIKLYDSFENGYNGNYGGQDGVKPSREYELWHPSHGEIKGTALYISEKIKCNRINIYQLTSGAIKSVKGYIQLKDKDNYDKIRKYKGKL